MAHANKKNSAVWPGKHASKLDKWVGPHQHVAEGISHDPHHEEIPAGHLSSKQYVKKEQKG